MQKEKIAYEELQLNVKNQVKIKEPKIIGYRWSETIYVFMLYIPEEFLK